MAGHAGLITLGHDLQRIPELEGKFALQTETAIFTAGELAHSGCAREPLATLAGMFCAKEALYKALPCKAHVFWPDLEVEHTPSGAPRFRLGGAVGHYFRDHELRVALSISHSGEYASAVVLISAAEKCDIG